MSSDAGHEVDEFSSDEAGSTLTSPSSSGLSLGESPTLARLTTACRISQQEQPRPPPDDDAEVIDLPGWLEFATDGDGGGDGGDGGGGGNGRVGGNVLANVPDFLGSLPSLMLEHVIKQLGLRELVRLGSSSGWLGRAVFEQEEMWTKIHRFLFFFLPPASPTRRLTGCSGASMPVSHLVQRYHKPSCPAVPHVS